VLGNVISWVAPLETVFDFGCHVRELGAGAAFMPIPPLVLAYLAILMKNSFRRAAFGLCVAAAVGLGLLNIVLVYDYVREGIWLGGLRPPVFFSSLVWWAHYVTGVPLPGLAMYFFGGWQGSDYLWPLGVYAVVLVALVRVYMALSSKPASTRPSA
jgi:hypothetical protein